MPTVPTYQRTETLRPAYRQDIEVRATPEAAGAEIGRGLQRFGSAVGQAADALVQVQAFDDENAAKDADNQFANWARERMYGEGGYLTLEGRNAVEGRKKFEEEADAKRREFGSTLRPGAARMFDRASQARLQSMGQQAIVHQANERKEWFRETSDARRTGFANDALASYTNPALVQKNIAAGLLELDNRGQLEGWSPEEMARQKSTYTSGVHGGVATRLMDESPIAADKYLKDNEASILPADMVKLRKTLAEPLKYAHTIMTVDAFANDLPVPDWSAGGSSSGGGGYEVVLGFGKYGKPPKPITQMTLDEVITFGKNVLIPNSKADGVGRDSRGLLGSSAVGAYQITQSTLQQYAPKVLGANWSRVEFTADVQDRLAEAIFNDSKSLGSGMSKVWASLSPSQAKRVSEMPWSQAKYIIAAGESGGISTSKKDGDAPEAWLSAMYKKAEAISDPEMREATFAEIDKRYNRQQRLVNASREKVVDDVQNRMIKDPSFDPSTLPVSVQQVIGLGGMNSLKSAYEARINEGKIKTDPVVFDSLLQEQAFDPEGFSKKDLTQYRSKLSDTDFLSLRSKQRGAVADLQGEMRSGSVYREAFTVAKEFHTAAGIKSGSGAQSEDNRKKEAQFNGAMRQEVDEFIQREKRKPTYDEMRTIASALTLNVIGSEARGAWSPMRLVDDAQDDVWTGKAFQRADAPAGSTKRVDVKITDVPAEWLNPIQQSLQKRFGRAPTKAEVATEWGNIAMQMIGGN